MWKRLAALFGKKGPQSSSPATAKVLSLLRPDQVFPSGFRPHAICGQFKDGQFGPEHFVANPLFVDLMHRVIRETAPLDPGFVSAAREQGSGSLSIIDLRTPDGVMGRVPIEDIVGIFAVSNGVAQASDYHPNARYQVFTANGLTQLPPDLHHALVQACLEP